ncbi:MULTISPECIES: hypothetical protein [Weissella]|jgi:protein subunit release factor A|uniref:DUF3847 domain-containing protein n=1 Tax=Weissella cibaria TaxID=137591 RepID=A0A0D1LS91_9LACO|nr:MULTISPECIES: hypothetical protein [Weissella]KIU18961.1 hypothetical protein QX99_02372 [Weissella cibaria]MBJ7651830.1 hypothetical protein [Weissella confusa]MCT0042980.1 hypothetical protein [Weissella confusa]
MVDNLDKLVQQKNELEKKIQKNELLMKQKQFYESNKERKLRTRKLIQKGALLDKYFDIDNLSVDDTESLLKTFAEYVKSNKPDKYKK